MCHILKKWIQTTFYLHPYKCGIEQVASTVKECLTKPKVLNPLSVPTKDKKRLILDVRYVNNHLLKDKIRFDYWNSFQNYLEDNKGDQFKFNLKSGYHHVDIIDEH